jgi:ABC-type Fe3+-hydroxamate transport system substrate-binding protein
MSFVFSRTGKASGSWYQVPLFLSCVAAACTPSDRQPQARGPELIIDDFDDTIRVATPATRIVSLNPTTTEILFAIGAGSRLVGRTKWDSWPDSAKYVEDVGDALRPNIEAVLAKKPDLVLLYASNDNRTAAKQLQASGVKVLAMKVDSIAEFERATSVLGALVGEDERAKNVVDSVRATLDRVRQATAAVPKKTVFYHTWEKPIITIGKHSFLNELVEIAGGKNVYDNVLAVSPIVTMEDIVSRNPDVFLVGPSTRAALLNSPQWQVVPAVKNKKVFAYDTMVVGRPSVTLGMAAVNLANLLHPGVVK